MRAVFLQVNVNSGEHKKKVFFSNVADQNITVQLSTLETSSILCSRKSWEHENQPSETWWLIWRRKTWEELVCNLDYIPIFTCLYTYTVYLLI